MKINLALAMAIFAILIISACTPQSAPSPAPAITPTPASVPTSNLSPVRQAQGEPSTSQDAAWAKVTEAAKKEGKATIYSFSFIGDTGLALQAGFKDRYNIQLEIIAGRGAEFVERIKTERRTGNIVADIMEGTAAHGGNLKAAGGTVATTDLPVLQDKNAFQVSPLINDPEEHLLAYRFVGIGPYYNTKLLKQGEEPKSYKDMLNPKWDGKILVGDPNLASATYEVFVTLMENKRLDVDTIKALGQRVKYAPGTRQTAEALARGEFPIGLLISDLDAAPFLKEEAPIKALTVQEGIITYGSTLDRIKDGPHPNAAKLFMEWMLRQEGQTIFTRTAGLSSVRKDVPDSRHPGSKSDSPVFPEDSIIAAKASQLFSEKYFVNLWKK